MSAAEAFSVDYADPRAAGGGAGGGGVPPGEGRGDVRGRVWWADVAHDPGWCYCLPGVTFGTLLDLRTAPGHALFRALVRQVPNLPRGVYTVRLPGEVEVLEFFHPGAR